MPLDRIRSSEWSNRQTQMRYRKDQHELRRQHLYWRLSKDGQQTAPMWTLSWKAG